MIANRWAGVVVIGLVAGPACAAARSQDTGPAPAKKPAPEAGRWGTLRGRVVFGGEAPPLKILVDPAESWPPMDRRTGQPIPGAPAQRIRDYEVMTRRPLILSERLLVDPGTRGVRDAIVYLARPTAVRDSALRACPKSVTLRADRGVFVPHVLAVTSGTDIVVGTDDPVLYNLDVSLRGARFTVDDEGPPEEGAPPFTYADRLNTLFGMIPSSKHTLKIRLQAGEPKPAGARDSLHNWMSSWWLVLDHPYVAVTDERGEFVLRDVPAGPQEVVVWQESVTARDREVFRGEVVILDGRPTTRDFTIDPRIVTSGP